MLVSSSSQMRYLQVGKIAVRWCRWDEELIFARNEKTLGKSFFALEEREGNEWAIAVVGVEDHCDEHFSFRAK